MQSPTGPHVSERVSQLAWTQLEHIRCWLVHSGTQLATMLAHNKDTVQSQDGDDSLDLVSNFESLLCEFQSLLIWENPCNSAVALTVFTFLYWIAVLMSPRIFSIIAVLCFCYHFYEMWTRYVWPEIRVPPVEIKENWTPVNPNVLSAPEIQNYMAKLKNLIVVLFCEAADLRRRSHGTFCFLSIASLGIFCLLGRIIPGVILVYACAIFFFLTPGFLLHVLPAHVLQYILDYCDNLSSPEDSQHKECQLADLDLQSQSAKDEQPSDEGSTPSPFKSQFYEHFFASENKSVNSSSSDLLEDFEVISDSDVVELDK